MHWALYYALYCIAVSLAGGEGQHIIMILIVLVKGLHGIPMYIIILCSALSSLYYVLATYMLLKPKESHGHDNS